jgi:uncharacterized repeat protein (TIGR01451 family)
MKLERMSTMRTNKWLAFCALILAGIFGLTNSRHASSSAASSPQHAVVAASGNSAELSPKARLVQNILQSPMSFESNQGQTDPRVKFLSRGSGYTLFLTSSEAVLALSTANPPLPAQLRNTTSGFGSNPGNPLSVGYLDRTPQPSPATVKPQPAPREDVLQMRLVGANSAPQVSGLDKTAAKSNYYIGNDPSKWRTNVSNYAKVHYAGVYPGVDLIYYGNQRQLEYDFVVAPGADPQAITLGFSQVHSEAQAQSNAGYQSLPLRISPEGDLVVHLTGGDVSFHKPLVYQTIRDGRTETRQPVDARYALKADGQASFELGPYDHRKPLVIDPTISFATYVGGSNEDLAMGIGVDKFTDVIIAGSTRSVDFPTFTPLETYHGGTCGTLPCRDVFVTKFNPMGTTLQYSTYIGGSSDDVGTDVVIDKAGDMFVVGYTLSTDFPVTTHATQKTFGGGTITGDAFVFELASKGIGLEYSTYLGGSSDDQAYSITLDSAPSATPSAYVVGYTTSTNFPTTKGSYQTVCGAAKVGTCENAFITKIGPSGTAIVYSSYLGGSGGLGDAAYGVAVDTSNNAYISGITGSPNFPTTSGAYDTKCGSDSLCNGSFDGFVTELNTTGTSLVFSTFLGGSSYDYAAGITVDTAGGIYVSGNTTSTDFPTTALAAQPTFGGMSAGCSPTTGAICGDVTVTKFNPGGGSLAYSTYLGGSLDEYPGISMAVDAFGNAYVTGQTASTNFPLVNPFQATYGGGSSDAFLTVVNSTGTAFTSSSYLGGNGQDFGYRVTLDPTGSIYLSGGTLSTNFPVKAGVFQTICGTDGTCNGGLMDAWVAKLAPAADMSVTITSLATVKSGANLPYRFNAKNNGPDTAVAVSFTDAIPAGTTFVSLTTSDGTCTTHPVGGTGTVDCTVPTLTDGSKITINMTVHVTAASGTVITDKASVSATTFDPKKSNNQAQKLTTVD